MSIHIAATPGQIAETVLLPGDPLRARYIAETHLDGAEPYNQVRGMLGFTGTCRGHRVSVQGTGMGIPSACIYAHELIRDFGVKNLIRVGSAGSLQKDVGVRDLVIAMAASTDSSINRGRFHGADYAPTASFELLEKAVAVARERGVTHHVGSVVSSDEFYKDDPETWSIWTRYGVLCAEMEAAGLYTVAANYGARALALLTVSDSQVSGESLSSDQRERSLDDMIQVALGMLPL